MRQRGERGLGGRGDDVGRTCGTKSLCGCDESGDGKALEFALQLVRGSEGELAHLGERLDARPAGRALGHDEDTDGLDGTVSLLAVPWARPDCAARAASTASRGSDLPP